MNSFELCVEQIRSAIAAMKNQEWDYPLGNNEVRQALACPPDVHPALSPLYSVADGLSLPDVYNGYFIDSASRVLTAQKRGEPTLVKGVRETQVIVFGSDGGGGRFALGVGDGCVYYLPCSGRVSDNTYFEFEDVSATEIGASVIQFFNRLRDDIEAFVHGVENHTYIEQEASQRRNRR